MMNHPALGANIFRPNDIRRRDFEYTTTTTTTTIIVHGSTDWNLVSISRCCLCAAIFLQSSSCWLWVGGTRLYSDSSQQQQQQQQQQQRHRGPFSFLEIHNNTVRSYN
jgi:hypothetical protein